MSDKPDGGKQPRFLVASGIRVVPDAETGSVAVALPAEADGCELVTIALLPLAQALGTAKRLTDAAAEVRAMAAPAGTTLH